SLALATNAARGAKTGDGYRTLDDEWCPRSSGETGPPILVRHFTAYCASRGGRFESSACTAGNSGERVLFYAKVAPVSICSSGIGARVQVIEPTRDELADGYKAALRAAGYRDSTDQMRAQVRATIAAQEDAEARARAAEDWRRKLSLMRKI